MLAQQYFINVYQSDSENVTGLTYFFKTCLVLAVLRLHCCVQAFLGCGARVTPELCAGLSLRWPLLRISGSKARGLP